MKCQCELHASEREIESSAVLHSVGFDTLGGKPFVDFIVCDDGGIATFGNFNGIAKVIAVTM